MSCVQRSNRNIPEASAESCQASSLNTTGEFGNGARRIRVPFDHEQVDGPECSSPARENVALAPFRIDLHDTCGHRLCAAPRERFSRVEISTSWLPAGRSTSTKECAHDVRCAEQHPSSGRRSESGVWCEPAILQDARRSALAPRQCFASGSNETTTERLSSARAKAPESSPCALRRRARGRLGRTPRRSLARRPRRRLSSRRGSRHWNRVRSSCRRRRFWLCVAGPQQQLANEQSPYLGGARASRACPTA